MKKAAMIIVLVCLSLCFVGCSPRPLKEAELQETVPEEVRTVLFNGESHVVELDSFEIENRQTEGTHDSVYSKLTYHFPGCLYTKKVKFDYSYSKDDGWVLDDYLEYEPLTWELSEREFFSEQSMEIELYLEYGEEELLHIDEDLEKGRVDYYFEVTKKHRNGTEKSNIKYTGTFDGSDSQYNWTYDKEILDSEFTWELSETEWGYYDESTNGTVAVHVIIESFDQTTGAISGSWALGYKKENSSSIDSVWAEKTDITSNTFRVNINDSTVEIENMQGGIASSYYHSHSFIRIGKDTATACIVSGYGSRMDNLDLERLD